jgi:hypothetical protein
MPRKKDQDNVNEIFTSLHKSLKKFTDEIKDPLRAWVKRQNIDSEEIMKMLMEAQTKASELRFIVERLHDSVKDGKTLKNSRFASRVVKKFLESSI